MQIFLDKNIIQTVKEESWLFSAGDQVAENWGLDLFEVDSDSSYKCDSNSSFPIEDGVVEIYFKDYQSQAFQFEDSDKSDTDYDTGESVIRC